MTEYDTQDYCRVCGAATTQLHDFGSICINDFPATMTHNSAAAPLILDMCLSCDLVQLRHGIEDSSLYSSYYWYQSNLNPVIVDNLKDIALYANDILSSSTNKTILDIGANDGTLLSFIDPAYTRVACEPAPNLQEELSKHSDVVINGLWNKIHMGRKTADVVTAIGMFYDLLEPNKFISDIADVLAYDGVFISQLMTLAPMVRMNDIGNICHEHIEYYSMKSLYTLFENAGLTIINVKENNIQGGSYQIHAMKTEWVEENPEAVVNFQIDESDIDTEQYIQNIKKTGQQLKSILQYHRDNNQCIAVYGASTKGNSILQLWELHDLFDCALEIHTDKIGRYTVGTNIPIVGEEAIKNVDVIYVPNFGYKSFFIKKNLDWIQSGGTMIFSMPELEIVTKENVQEFL